MSTSSSATSTVSATASATTSAAAKLVTLPSQFKIVGVVLAVLSGVLIGSSFVFKKKGLLATQGDKLGEGVAYLKSPMWWTGMIMMILGEVLNFAAYSFVEAIVVTPLGALSVVICAILSHFFLKESLTVFGAIGCALCIVGSVVIALNGPKEETVGQIEEFQKLFLAPGFLAYTGVVILVCLVIIIFVAPRYGDKSMLWYITVCSLIGGLSVSCTTGLGAAIVTSILGDNQFKHWFIFFLLGFVTVTLLTEIFYLNKALALFNTALVTPTYYVIFTTCTMITTIILFQGLKAPASSIITLVMGFLTICLGITLLQMSKVDPTHLTKLDRRSTILLQAARNQTELQEKSIAGFEDPGIDSLRGGFGTIGSIIRARSVRKMSMSGAPPGAEAFRHRHPYAAGADAEQHRSVDNLMPGVQRHQLWDAPVPGPQSSPSVERISMQPPRQRHRSIRFGDELSGGVGQGHEAYVQSPTTPSRLPSGPGSLNASPPPSRMTSSNLTASPPATRYDGLPPISTIPVSPFEMVDPFADNPKTARPADYKSPSLESASTDSLDQQVSGQVKSPHAHLYPRGNSDSDREESASLVANPDGSIGKGGGVRLVRRI